MPTQLEAIFRVRDLLGNPSPQSPSFHQILRQVLSDQTDIVNDLNNTGKTWTVAEYTLNYPGNGQDTFNIPVTNFGKPLFVVRLLNNPYVKAIPVPFDDLTDAEYGTVILPFYAMYQGLWAPSNTIERMSFFRTGVFNQEYKVKIQPVPQGSCQYVISYAAGYLSSDNPLDAVMAMPEFATLTELRSAMALLPYAKWGEDMAENMMVKKELMASFAYQVERKEDAFQKYKKTLVHARVTELDDWGGYY